MKKLILVIIAFTAIITNNYAQGSGTDMRDKLAIGVKMGLNYSNVYDTQGENFVADPKLGFAFGGFLSIPIGTFLGVQPEFLFSQRGFKGSGRLLGTDYGMTRTSNFIDIPLLVTLKPSPIITILAGPQYSYLIKQKDEFTSGNTTVQQETEFKNENIRKNILCFTGGLDINLQYIVIGARAGWDLSKNNGDGSSTTPRYKNRWYQATIGFRF